MATFFIFLKIFCVIFFQLSTLMDYSSFSELSLSIKNKITKIYHQTIGRFIGSLFKKPSSILFLGLDNAGKTTLVNKLKSNTNHVYMPTLNPSTTELQIGNLKAKIMDVGGHKAARMFWKKFCIDIDGIVFIVDTADEEKYLEVQQAWESVLEFEKEAPILVLMNKVDHKKHTAQSAELDTAFKEQIQADTHITTSGNPGQAIKLVYLNIIGEDINRETTPLRTGFSWLSDIINEKNKAKSKSLL